MVYSYLFSYLFGISKFTSKSTFYSFQTSSSASRSKQKIFLHGQVQGDYLPLDTNNFIKTLVKLLKYM